MGDIIKIAFEGSTLDEAYKKATEEFNCSITELKSEVIQVPTSGFLGFFKKSAIIEVYRQTVQSAEKLKVETTEIDIKEVEEQIEELDKKDISDLDIVHHHESNDEKIFDTFYTKPSEEDICEPIIKKQSDEDILVSIKKKIDILFSQLCYNIDDIRVSYYDEQTIFIEFNGEDSALLIGKEGYRYKALSYILFNWIHEEYNLMVRLEIAEFLKQQEEAINNYLTPVIEVIKEEGKYKTKPLDGILVHIALKKLRDEFPDKYVAVKSTKDGNKYILVAQYRNY